MDKSENSKKRKKSRKHSKKNKRARTDQSKDRIAETAKFEELVDVVEDDNQEDTTSNDYFDRFFELGILQKILKYSQSRVIPALVSRAFYMASAEVDSKTDIYKLNIDNNIPLESVFDSIMFSSRILKVLSFQSMVFVAVDEVTGTSRINEENFENLIEVLEKCTESIESLTFNKCLFMDDHVIKILHSIRHSNIKHISITNSGILQSSILLMKTTKNCFPCLTSIDMNGTNLGYLPVPAGAIEDFHNSIQRFFELLSTTHQTRLKKFVALRKVLRIMPMDKFYFETLGIINIKPSELRIATIIQRQYQLKHLDLSGSFIMDDVISEIIKLTKLETLKINCDGISIKSFAKLATLNLNELQVEVNAQSHWISTIMSVISFPTLKKFALIIPNLKVGVDAKSDKQGLREMIPRGIKELHLVTSQPMALQSVMTCDAIRTLTTISVEITSDKNPRAPRTDFLFKRLCLENFVLENLIIVNGNPNLYELSNQLIILLEQCPALLKLHVDGFKVTEQLHHGALRHCVELEHLSLKCTASKYLISKRTDELIEDCIELKKMSVSCKGSNYHDRLRFPVELKTKTEFIYRHR